jgi:hypothetical protein
VSSMGISLVLVCLCYTKVADTTTSKRSIH